MTRVLVPLFVAAVAASSAQARTYEVNRLGDPAPNGCSNSHCTLREAVLAANASVGVADKIVLPNGKGTYRLQLDGTAEDGAADGDLDITNDRLAIRHPGKGRATIDASGGNERAFQVFAPASFTKLAITGGSDAFGGAIHGSADVRVARTILRGNESSSVGGAIDMDGLASLRILRSVLRGNESTGSTGGAIRDGEGGPVAIIRSKLIGNTAESDGGAIRLSNSPGTIIQSVFRNNRSVSGEGGAIQTDLSGGPTVISRTTIEGNRAGTDGGGVETKGDGQLRIVSSTLSGNRAIDDGAGLYAGGGTIDVVNSTFSRNVANSAGGGIAAVATPVSLNAVTIVRNVADADDNEGIAAIGGGLFGDTPDNISVRNTIVALNTDAAVGNDCAGNTAIDSLGHNLISTDLGCGTFDGPGDRIRANPKVGSLKRNGGPTKTIALKTGSAAIGNAHKPSAPNRDQRGRVRDSKPDIGAFERGA